MDDHPECYQAEMVITGAYQEHIALFRDFAEKTGDWLTNYEQTMAPMLMECLEKLGNESHAANWQLLNSLTTHAGRFASLTEKALAEYEEAYKTAMAIFEKIR